VVQRTHEVDAEFKASVSVVIS